MHTTELYFECHITIDPVEGERLREFRMLAELRGFRVAELLMRKGCTMAPSDIDSFATGRHQSYAVLSDLMIALCFDLMAAGYKVRRRKIENTLLDQRFPTLGN